MGSMCSLRHLGPGDQLHSSVGATAARNWTRRALGPGHFGNLMVNASIRNVSRKIKLASENIVKYKDTLRMYAVYICIIIYIYIVIYSVYIINMYYILITVWGCPELST